MCFYVKRLAASGCKQTQVIPGWLDEWKYVHWMVLKWAAECQWGPILELVVLNVKTGIIQKTPTVARPFWRLLAFTFLKWSLFVGGVFNLLYLFELFYSMGDKCWVKLIISQTCVCVCRFLHHMGDLKYFSHMGAIFKATFSKPNLSCEQNYALIHQQAVSDLPRK